MTAEKPDADIAKLCEELRGAYSTAFPRSLARRAAAALESQVRENESLRAECGLRQIQGYREGMAKTERKLAASEADAERLSWLATMVVRVAVPLRYGSKDLFVAVPDLEEDESDLRALIAAARVASAEEEK